MLYCVSAAISDEEPLLADKTFSAIFDETSTPNDSNASFLSSWTLGSNFYIRVYEPISRGTYTPSKNLLSIPKVYNGSLAYTNSYNSFDSSKQKSNLLLAILGSKIQLAKLNLKSRSLSSALVRTVEFDALDSSASPAPSIASGVARKSDTAFFCLCQSIRHKGCRTPL